MRKQFLVSVLVFVVCLGIGFWIAGHRPLWNDEMYSLASSTIGKTYLEMFSGRISEGNNSPLYYALEKSIIDVTHYHLPEAWQKGDWSFKHVLSQILLRVNPVVCMSLSMALIFYYFYRRYALLVALYSLFVYSTSYMLWAYWAEARPYALLVLLTTVQSLLFLNILENKSPRNWWGLAITNILLGLTFVMSLAQIAASSLLLWIWRERDWKKYIDVTFIPCAIALFYYFHAPKYGFCFGLTPEQLVRDNMSREKLNILIVFTVFLTGYFLQRRFAGFKLGITEDLIKPLPYFVFTVLMIAATAAVLLIFVWKQLPPNQGFAITSRYFIYLMPIGVIAVTACSAAIMRSLSAYRWLQVVLFLTIGWLLAQRFIKIVPAAIRSILNS